MNEIELLKKEIEELKAWKTSMEASHSIPLNIDQALRDRLNLTSGSLALSTKDSNSEDRAVNEGGVAIYNVITEPVGFLQIEISGTIYYLPYYGA